MCVFVITCLYSTERVSALVGIQFESKQACVHLSEIELFFLCQDDWV